MRHALEVYLPAQKALITQRFGDNANLSYARDGLKGHSAYDWGMPYGAPIPNCVPNAYCYSNMHENDPVLMDYRAVFFIVETDTGVYEISYGHLSKHTATVGKTYQVGETIGFVGNTGDCFSGSHEVTEAEKRAGSHAGAHLHGPQVRVLKKTKKLTSRSHPLYDENGLLEIDGYYFDVPDYGNGYNGCVSLASFSTETLASDYIGPSGQVPSKVIQEGLKAVSAALEATPRVPVAEQGNWLEALKSFLLNLLGASKK